MSNSYISEGAENELKLLMYISFATIYHRLSDHSMALEYADKGIETSLETEDLKFLYFFYFRKTIAMYRMEIDGWADCAQKCVSYLCVTNQASLCKYIIGVMSRQYPEVYTIIEQNNYLLEEVEKLLSTIK